MYREHVKTTEIQVPECARSTPSPLCECVSTKSNGYDPICVQNYALQQQENRHPGLMFYFAEDGPSVDFSSSRMTRLMFASIYSTLLQHCPGDVIIVMYSNSVSENSFRTLQQRGYPIAIRRYDLEELFSPSLSPDIIHFVRTFWSEHKTRDSSSSSSTTGKACWGTDKNYVPGKYDLVQFSDIFRYLVLYKYGGTFNDVDSILIRSMVRVSKRQNLVGRSVASPCRPAKFEDFTTKCLPSWIGIDYDTSKYDVGYEWYLSNGLFVGMSPKSKYVLRLLELMKSTYLVNCECCLGRNLLTRAYNDLYFPSTVSLDRMSPIFRAPRPFIRTLPVTRMWLWRYQVDPKTRKTIGLIDAPYDESNFRYWIRTQNSYTVHLDTQATCAKNSYCDVILNSVISAWLSVQEFRRENANECVVSSSFESSIQDDDDEDPDWEKRTTMLISSREPWRLREPPSTILSNNDMVHVRKWNLVTTTRELEEIKKPFVVLRLSWMALSGTSSTPMPMGGWLGRTVISKHDDRIVVENPVYNLNARGFDSVLGETMYTFSPKGSFEVRLSSLFLDNSGIDSKHGGNVASALWVGL